MKRTKIIFIIIVFFTITSNSNILFAKNKKHLYHKYDGKINTPNIFLDFYNNINSSILIQDKNCISHGSDFYNDTNLSVLGKVNNKTDFFISKKLKHPEQYEEQNYYLFDLAYLKHKLNDKFNLIIGKQPIPLGSTESSNSDDEKSDTYIYSDLYKIKTHPIGIDFVFLPVKNHKFQLQIANNININRKDGSTIPTLGGTINWNWKKDLMENKWSYSIFKENEKNKFWKLLALGSKLNLKPIIVEGNYIFSEEDIEKNGELTNILQNYHDKIPSTKFGTYILKLKYNFSPKWNVFAKGSYEIGIYKNKEKVMQDDQEHVLLKSNQLFKKSYTYGGGIEFFPSNENLSVNLAYQNRIDNYPIYKKENKNEHFILLGMNYRMKIK
ncbi:porin [Blattabacterium cuenoti]|uniref:porin n=1 Tax=Blattabacterium cuenoti TaxID=1653831 RepID=UPI00163B8C12|nr:porin [Blattabacterium cuenoti]